MRMEMTQEEQTLLRNALNHYLSELSGEIGSTDNSEFRNDLKHEKEVLLVLKSRMESGGMVSVQR